MEPMRITVESVRRRVRSGVVVAQVRAASRERVGKVPRAVIRLTLQLSEPQPTVSQARLKEMAKDEALRFLDVS